MKKLIFLCIAALAAVSCNNAGTKSGKNGKDKAVESGIPVFNSDSCYAFVEKQTGFGPRVPGSNAHSECAAYFEDFFNRLGLETEIQEAELSAWDGKVINAKNIIASVNPEAKARIFICAHWDSRPWCDEDPDPANHGLPVMGANDGASGIGVLLEIARILSENEPEMGIDILFTDAEDWGDSGAGDDSSWALGTQYWTENPHRKGYQYPSFGILLDMVGDRNAKFLKEYFSVQAAGSIVEKLWTTAASLGYDNYFINTQGGAMTDDHVFLIRAGIPCVDIIDQRMDSDTGFCPQWHTTSDTMRHIDRNTLEAVGQTVVTMLFGK